MTERSVVAGAKKIARNSLYGLLHPKFASDWLDELGGSYQEYLLRKAVKGEPPMAEDVWRSCAVIFDIRERQDFG